MEQHISEHPLVSIVVPVYNNEGRIACTLEGLVTQDYPNIEIIVVDDASIDKTEETTRNLLKGGVRDFDVITHEKNRGVAAARNTGLNAARGKYVWFCDSDDLMEKNFVSLLCDKAEQVQADIVFCGHKDYYEEDNRIVEHPIKFSRYSSADDYIAAWVRGRFWCGVWCCLFRKKFLDDARLRFIEGCPLGEDSEFMFKAFVSGERISFIKQPLYIYVHHSNQQTAIRRGERKMFHHNMLSRLRQARYIIKHGTEFQRDYMLHFFIPETYIKKLTRSAREKDRMSYELQLRTMRHRKAKELLLSTARFFHIAPTLFFKAIMLLYFPKTYYRLRS
ncbi:MAG: glycosyltransferase family 2 protein [Fretibacterium sp.]|nr:glycosyltransferase family 2 protein [Fretibacterium sp.]